jgi:hypothetical protein
VITLGPVKYDGKDYPEWAVGFGWCLGVASMVPIPIIAITSLLRAEGTFSEVKKKKDGTLNVCFLCFFPLSKYFEN